MQPGRQRHSPVHVSLSWGHLAEPTEEASCGYAQSRLRPALSAEKMKPASPWPSFPM